MFVLVHDPYGRIFVHRRAADKALFPSRYDMFVGGAVAAGESYHDAARREAEEELGLTGPAPTPVPLLKFRYATPEHTWWCAVYQLRCDAPVTPPTAEVAWYSFLTEAELHE